MALSREAVTIHECLPTLPTEVSDLIPLADQEQIALLDAATEALVTAARAKNFSEHTISSILSTRTRIYKERGEAWQEFSLLGSNIVEIDALQDDTDVYRWINGKIIETVTTTLDAAVQFDERTSIYTPFSQTSDQGDFGSKLSQWRYSNGLYGADDLVAHVKDDYIHFLATGCQSVIEQLTTFLSTLQPTCSRSLLQTVAKSVASRYGKETFGAFDTLFVQRAAGGMEQLQGIEPFSTETPQKDGRFRLLGRGALLSKLDLTDHSSTEYEALSRFFGVSQQMTTLVAKVKSHEGIQEFEAEFEAATGIDTLTAFIQSKAQALLGQALSDKKIEAFFEQYEADVDAYCKRYSRYYGRTSGHQHQSSTTSDGPETGSQQSSAADDNWAGEYKSQLRQDQEKRRQVIINEDFKSGTILFTGAALLETVSRNNLITSVSDLLKKYTKTNITDTEVLTSLLTAIAENRDIDKNGDFTDKKMWRRLILTHHPEAIFQREERKATPEEVEFSAVLNSLFTLREQGKLLIQRDGDWSAVRTHTL